MSHENLISIDPDIAFGRPCVKGTGIAVDVIFDRFAARETIPELADDYGITEQQVNAAIDYEYERLSGMDIRVFDLKEKLKRSIRAYEMLINAVPTGRVRNELTIERIEIEKAISDAPSKAEITKGKYTIGFDFGSEIPTITIFEIDQDGHAHIVKEYKTELKVK